MRITLLHEEMSQYLEGWKTSRYATEAQKTFWPQNRKLTQKSLGCDHENCLKLLVEDGFDGQPVGTAPVATARHYFWDNEGHGWIPDRDLVRFGIFFHIDFYRLLVLVLKGQWERFFSREINWKKDDRGRGLFDILKRSPREAMDVSARFKSGLNKTAGKKELHHLFEEHGRLANNAGYDEERFGILIDQMILSYCHLFGTCSDELEDFILKQREEQKVLLDAAEHLNEAYWIKKCAWVEIQNELDNKLLELENYRLQVANVNQKWLETFGQVYLPLMEAETMYHAIQRRLQLKKASPELSREEIERLERESQIKEAGKLEALRDDLAKAMMIKTFEPNARYLNGEELTDYEKECKRVLREIYKHAHPDGIQHCRFSENQRGKLREYFERAIAIRTKELGGDVRQLDVLCDILASVNSLWESMGIDIREDAVIQGSRLEDKLQWLETRTQRLEEEIRAIKAEIFVLANHPNVQEQRACMTSEEQIANTIKQMEEKRRFYEDQAGEADAQFNSLFDTGEFRR